MPEGGEATPGELVLVPPDTKVPSQALKQPVLYIATPVSC
jgi:hypothetical protein